MNASGLSPAIGTTYCGPTAIAALTGIDPATVETAFVRYRLSHPKPKPRGTAQRVKTVWSDEVEGVLALLGWRAASYDIPHGMVRRRGRAAVGLITFATWYRGRKRANDQARYLVLVNGHFVAMHAGWFADTRFRHPVELKRLCMLPHGRKRVMRTWRIEPINA